MNKDELKQYRERIGLNQGELSKALGVANNTVSRWELGQRSIPEFLPLALETIERRLSTVGSIDNKSTVGSSESSKARSIDRVVDISELKTMDVDEVFDRLKEKVSSGDFFKNSVLDIVQSSSDNEKLLSTAECAEQLGINERTVRDNYNNGKLPFVKRGTKNLVRESDFIVFRDSRNSA
jgi:excisionase family DNA binding protein